MLLSSPGDLLFLAPAPPQGDSAVVTGVSETGIGEQEDAAGGSNRSSGVVLVAQGGPAETPTLPSRTFAFCCILVCKTPGRLSLYRRPPFSLLRGGVDGGAAEPGTTRALSGRSSPEELSSSSGNPPPSSRSVLPLMHGLES